MAIFETLESKAIFVRKGFLLSADDFGGILERLATTPKIFQIRNQYCSQSVC